MRVLKYSQNKKFEKQKGQKPVSAQRGEFGSRFGFIMAAAGSAVGLGNIWGFPTQAASNGGAAFVLVYLVLAFLLAYPVLMAELTLGRHAHGNMIAALAKVSRNGTQRGIGTMVGIVGIFTASLILSFYAIVSGWMLGFGAAYPLAAMGASDTSAWLTTFGESRNLLLMLIFMVLTMVVVAGGVEKGIERWSKRLMPAMIVTLVLLSGYVLTLDGASKGLAVYLIPDVSKSFRQNWSSMPWARLSSHFHLALAPCSFTALTFPMKNTCLPSVHKSRWWMWVLLYSRAF
jgi:NSS family neurotransmitter:Na+ symporter